MTDDQGPWAMGSGHPNAHTPYMDQLAREGVRLTNAMVTTPVCSPARAGFLTSRYSTEVGILDWLNHAVEPDHGLNPSFPAWPHLLNRAGYRTGLIGKWHLGTADKYHPRKFGYQHFIGFRVGAMISKDPLVEISGQERRIEGYTPDILTDFAIDFIRRNRNDPFMLSLHTWAPHANVGVFTEDGDRTWLPLSDTDWDRFRKLDPQLPNPDYSDLDIARSKRMTREYLGSVASVDRNVGRLLKVLDELDLAENTIVIFTSDNGYSMAHNGIWHKGNGRWLLTDKQGSRPNLYDNSLHIPALVRWPARLDAGRVVDQVVTNLDWFPTLLAMAGVPLSQDIGIHGRNFLPLLEGRSIAWNNDLFGQYAMQHDDNANLRCYRTLEWKLIRDFARTGKDELYDLKNDPQERWNLIDSDDPTIRQMIGELDKKLRAKMRAIKDQAG